MAEDINEYAGLFDLKETVTSYRHIAVPAFLKTEAEEYMTAQAESGNDEEKRKAELMGDLIDKAAKAKFVGPFKTPKAKNIKLNYGTLDADIVIGLKDSQTVRLDEMSKRCNVKPADYCRLVLFTALHLKKEF